MRRPHAFVIALLLGIALVSASYAVLRTTALGLGAKQQASVSDRQIAARKARLDKIEAALARALAKKPPALPGLPKRRSVVPPVSRAAPAAAIPASNRLSASSSSSEPNDDSGGGGEDDGGGDDD